MNHAWVSFSQLTRHEFGQEITDTLVQHVELPPEVGGRILCSDPNGSTREGTVVFVDRDIVSILLDRESK